MAIFYLLMIILSMPISMFYLAKKNDNNEMHFTNALISFLMGVIWPISLIIISIASMGKSIRDYKFKDQQ